MVSPLKNKIKGGGFVKICFEKCQNIESMHFP